MAYSSSKDLRELLRDFLTGQNREESFRAVSERLSGLIYHAAYRQSGDATVAEEVTQNVLIQVSRKAGKVVKHPEILAWVHEVTRLEVLQMRRGSARRKKREEKAMKEMEFEESIDPGVRADLDESLRYLSLPERELILMRFFEGRTFPAIASVTGRSETAEKKRLKKALEKLAGWFGKKGVALSVVGLTTVLATEMGKAAPVGLGIGVGGSVAVGAGAGSGKLAVGVALLVAAGFAVPFLSKWGEVRELEKRLGELSQVEVTNSARSGRVSKPKPKRGVGVIIRRMEEDMTVAEIVEMSIWEGSFGDVLEEEILKRQLGRLELEELVEVATRLHASYGKEVANSSSGDDLVLKELRKRLEPMTPQERLEFLIPLRISISLALDEFEDWAEVASADEVGTWLREHQGFLEKHMWGTALQRDVEGKMWRVYLSKLSTLKLGDAARELREASLTAAQTVKWVNDLANDMGNRRVKRDDELIAREYRLSKGSLQTQWGKLILRVIDDDLERIGEWMTEHQFEAEERRGLLRGALRNLHPDLKKKGFTERLDWLRRNVPGEEWEGLLNSSFVRDHDENEGRSGSGGLAEGFEEALSKVVVKVERDALIVTAAGALIFDDSNHVGQVETTISFLSQITEESKRDELVVRWLGVTERRKPEVIPFIERALRVAGLKEEGGSE